MKRYLVETYLAHGATAERVAHEQRARSAAAELTREARRVRFDHSIHVPEDEICFFVFDAPSSRDAALVAERAGLDAVRIVEAISSREEER
jgi:aminoglycoside phosphotransferase